MDLPVTRHSVLAAVRIADPDVRRGATRPWSRCTGSRCTSTSGSNRASPVTRLFQVFQRYDLDAPTAGVAPTYPDVAKAFGVSATDVTNYLSAARKTFRRLLLDRLRSICGDTAEFESEARHLLRGGLR